VNIEKSNVFSINKTFLTFVDFIKYHFKINYSPLPLKKFY
jgi:hypothetical protein